MKYKYMYMIIWMQVMMEVLAPYEAEIHIAT